MNMFMDPCYKMVAQVAMGEPDAEYKDHVQQQMLKEKQTRMELEWSKRKLEMDRKRAIMKKQKEIEAARKRELEAKAAAEAAAKAAAEAAAKAAEEDIGASAQALAGQRLLEKEPGEYAVGETLELKVTNVNVNENKIAVGQLDRPKVASGPQVESRNFADIKVGEKVKGIVRVAKDYGVFVDIGLPRRDGLMPTSYMGSRASTDFEPNQEVEVYVVRIDAGTERVTLSIEEPKEDEFGGRKRRGFSPAPDYIPSGDMAVDREYYINVHCDGDESYVWDEPLPWKEWETKYPGIVTFPKIETEVYPPAKGGGGGFSGLEELHTAQSVYIPMPVHLRRPDAGPPDQPRDDLDDYQIGYDYGIKPEIHVKYRTPPFNDPNWTFDRRAGSLYPDLMYTDDKQK